MEKELNMKSYPAFKHENIANHDVYFLLKKRMQNNLIALLKKFYGFNEENKIAHLVVCIEGDKPFIIADIQSIDKKKAKLMKYLPPSLGLEFPLLRLGDDEILFLVNKLTHSWGKIIKIDYSELSDFILAYREFCEMYELENLSSEDDLFYIFQKKHKELYDFKKEIYQSSYSDFLEKHDLQDISDSKSPYEAFMNKYNLWEDDE